MKEELLLRVKLQKKYRFDANGKLQSLERFLKEIIHFIISNAHFDDFKLLNTLQDKQIDYGYMINTIAKHNQIQSMQYMQKNLLGNSNEMLNDAMLYAVKSNSLEMTLYLMQQDIQLDSRVIDESMKHFKNEENDIFYKKLKGLNDTKLLPFIDNTEIIKRRRKAKIDTQRYEHEYITTGTLRDIVYNSLVDMYNLYYLDDFTAKIYENSLDVCVYSETNIYPCDFIKMFEELLLYSGFEDYINVARDQDEHTFGVKADSRAYNNYSGVVDYYDFINIEIV